MKTLQRAASQPALKQVFSIASDDSTTSTPPSENQEHYAASVDQSSSVESNGVIFRRWADADMDTVRTPRSWGFLTPFQDKKLPSHEEILIQKERLFAAKKRLWEKNRPYVKQSGSDERIIVDEVDTIESELEAIASALEKLESGAGQGTGGDLVGMVDPDWLCRCKRIPSTPFRAARATARATALEKKVDVFSTMENIPPCDEGYESDTEFTTQSCSF